MRNFWALPALLRIAIASQNAFSVQDDILAYPQFQVVIAKEHVSELQAQSRVVSNEGLDKDLGTDSSDTNEIAVQSQQPGGGSEYSKPHQGTREQFEYDILKIEDDRYLCQIPQVAPFEPEDVNTTLSKADEERELQRANERGWELLQGMHDNCIYYWSGWWSYSYCHGEGVKQFHQLPPRPGIPQYPPTEDPAVTGFVLGSTEDGIPKPEATGLQEREVSSSQTTAMGSLETRGENRYLVQRLGGGTVCDLTGKDRRVEVQVRSGIRKVSCLVPKCCQFHCNPAASDRISLIKEIATCAYLMVIQTPRLCSDVAFLPPQKDRPNVITCNPILAPEDVPAYESEIAELATQKAVGAQIPGPFSSSGQSQAQPQVGGIQVGARKWIPEGSDLEKTAIVGGGKETFVETIADSFGKLLTPEQLKKMGLGDPKTVEALKKKLDKMAGDKDWKLEVFDTPRGREYRGVIDHDDEGEGKDKDKKSHPGKEENGQDEQKGSEEEYKAKEEL